MKRGDGLGTTDRDRSFNPPCARGGAACTEGSFRARRSIRVRTVQSGLEGVLAAASYDLQNCLQKPSLLRQDEEHERELQREEGSVGVELPKNVAHSRAHGKKWGARRVGVLKVRRASRCGAVL